MNQRQSAVDNRGDLAPEAVELCRLIASILRRIPISNNVDTPKAEGGVRSNGTTDAMPPVKKFEK